MSYISESLRNLLDYIIANRDTAMFYLIGFAASILTITASIIAITKFITKPILWLISRYKRKKGNNAGTISPKDPITTPTQSPPIKPNTKKPISATKKIIRFILLYIMIWFFVTIIIIGIDNYKSKTPFDNILCELDNYDKCYILGNTLTEEQDFCKAKNAYETACNGKIIEACNALAIIYDEGKCTAVGQNINEAIILYEKACANSIKTACDKAGLRHEHGGNGFPVNVEKALKYYDRACKINYEEFCDNYDRLFKKNYFKDNRNYKDYKIKQIGNQTWFMEDIQYRVNKYNWGDALQYACPVGWRLPNNEDWALLKANAKEQDIKDFAESSSGEWWSASDWAYLWIVRNGELKKETAATDNYHKNNPYSVRCVK